MSAEMCELSGDLPQIDCTPFESERDCDVLQSVPAARPERGPCSSLARSSPRGRSRPLAATEPRPRA